MANNLRKELARSQLEGKNTHSGPYDPKLWAQTVRMLNETGGYPEPRFPVLIGPPSVLSTPEMLQQLAELPEVPNVIKTHQVTFWTSEPVIPEGRAEPEEIRVCGVSLGQLEIIQRKTEWRKDLDLIVRFGGESKLEPKTGTALVVLAIKDGGVAGSASGPYDPQKWVETVKMLKETGGYPAPRFPVLIGSPSLISSPEMLQQLVELEETPAIIPTYQVAFGSWEPIIPVGRTEPEEVRICEIIGWAQLKMLQQKTECKQDLDLIVRHGDGSKTASGAGQVVVVSAIRGEGVTDTANASSPPQK